MLLKWHGGLCIYYVCITHPPSPPCDALQRENLSEGLLGSLVQGPLQHPPWSLDIHFCAPREGRSLPLGAYSVLLPRRPDI